MEYSKEFYNSLDDPTVDPFNYTTEREYVLDHNTFRKFTKHPYVLDTYMQWVKYDPFLTEFILHGITFKLVGVK